MPFIFRSTAGDSLFTDSLSGAASCSGRMFSSSWLFASTHEFSAVNVAGDSSVFSSAFYFAAALSSPAFSALARASSMPCLASSIVSFRLNRCLAIIVCFTGYLIVIESLLPAPCSRQLPCSWAQNRTRSCAAQAIRPAECSCGWWY